MSTTKTLHEKYHSTTKRQSKIIKDNNFTYRILVDVFNKKINKPNLKILDIGCGAGTISFYLANKGHDVLGIDISQKAINECLQSKKELGLNNLDFEQFDFPNNYPKQNFDFVIFTEVIEHLEDDSRALQVINKLLKPNGIMILSTPSDKAPLHRMGLTKEFDKKVGHVRRYSEKEIVDLIKENNFVVNKIYRTEGILRNFLFVNPIAGKFIRFIKFFASDLVTYLDNLTIPLFGSSDIIIIAKKA